MPLPNAFALLSGLSHPDIDSARAGGRSAEKIAPIRHTTHSPVRWKRYCRLTLEIGQLSSAGPHVAEPIKNSKDDPHPSSPEHLFLSCRRERLGGRISSNAASCRGAPSLHGTRAITASPSACLRSGLCHPPRRRARSPSPSSTNLAGRSGVAEQESESDQRGEFWNRL
jgi:hypothetical protein